MTPFHALRPRRTTAAAVPFAAVIAGFAAGSGNLSAAAGRLAAGAGLALLAASCTPATPVAPAPPSAPAPPPAEVEVPAVTSSFDPALAPFSLRFGAVETSLRLMSAFVMPGSDLEFEVHGTAGAPTATAAAGHVSKTGPASWRWTAPNQHGIHDIVIRDGRTRASITLRAFVLRPWDGRGNLGGHRVGRYVENAKDGDPAYVRPQGFIEATPREAMLEVTPHFRLGQFLCKNSDAWPRYLALRSELLVKLETLLAALAARGFPASSLHVMSGFRTPAYNATIGNETALSRHLYGDAADVFLDRDGDEIQDDIDRDGRSTRDDARLMMRIAEEALDGGLPEHLQGGLSAYGSTKAHGPFLHVDARGKRARW